MRMPTQEEVALMKEIHKPNISKEEYEKIKKRLIEISIEATGGKTWLN